MERHTHNGIDSLKLSSDLFYDKNGSDDYVAVRDSSLVKKIKWTKLFNDSNTVIVQWDKIQDMDNSQHDVSGTSWTKYTDFEWNDADGYVNLSVLVSDNDNKDDIEVKFYKNGVAISSAFTNGGTQETFTFDDVAVTRGDTLEVWARVVSSEPNRAWVDEFYIKYIRICKS